MWHIRLARAAWLHGLASLLIPILLALSAAQPARGQTANNGGPTATAAPRQFGGSSATAGSRAVVVTRGASSPRSTQAPTVRPSSVVRSAAPINGTNVANRVPAAARSGDAAPGVITRGQGAAGTPGVITRGHGASDAAPGTITRGFGGNDAAPGVITRGFGAPNAAAPGAITRGFGANNGYGGVAVNPAAGTAVNPAAGAAVNRAYGWDRGPAVIGPSGANRNEPAIEQSEWARRYRERYNSAYPTGDNIGDITSPYNPYSPYDPYYYGRYSPYSPVFLDSNGPVYVNNNNNYWLGFDPLAAQVGAVNPPAQETAPDPKNHEQANEKAEAPAQEKPAERKRAAPRISPEKLHDLMKEGLALFEAGKYGEAASKFLRVTLADRQNVDATLAYAAARFATGDYQISGLAVRRAVRRMPDVVNSPFDIRARYGNPHDFEVHLARLEQYLLDHEDEEDAWIVLGFVRHFSGQRDLAAQTFDRVRGLPGADIEVAETFLAARPGQAGPAQTQPADALPAIGPGVPPVLPAAVARAEQLISVEAAD